MQIKSEMKTPKVRWVNNLFSHNIHFSIQLSANGLLKWKVPNLILKMNAIHANT